MGPEMRLYLPDCQAACVSFLVTFLEPSGRLFKDNCGVLHLGLHKLLEGGEVSQLVTEGIGV